MQVTVTYADRSDGVWEIKDSKRRLLAGSERTAIMARITLAYQIFGEIGDNTAGRTWLNQSIGWCLRSKVIESAGIMYQWEEHRPVIKAGALRPSLGFKAKKLTDAKAAELMAMFPKRTKARKAKAGERYARFANVRKAHASA